MSVELFSLGAAQEVTGSKHIIEVNGRQVMIDCGAFQGKREETNKKNQEFSVPLETLDAVALTHGHYDHCGLLPVLVKKGYKGNIYATPATRDIANIVMMDSAKIQARDAEYLSKQARKKNEHFSGKPLFDEKDVIKAENHIISIPYNRKMLVSSNVLLEFFDAGHILGSGLAYLTITDGAEEKRVLFTGDLGRKKKPIIRDPAINFPPPDYIVLESTYGNRKHSTREFAIKELEKVVNETCRKKGKIIIPSFAIERAQELIFQLHLLLDEKRIPKIPIYVDSPMAANVTSVFRSHPECYDEEVNEAFTVHHENPFGFGGLSFTASVEESKMLNEKSGPMIIISADGMCEAGRILYHLDNGIGDERNTILIVGYMAENTLGRKILNGEKEVWILGEKHHVNAAVKQINAFSAHADYTEMMDWLKSIDTSRLKKIFLVHGEKDAQAFFEKYLHQNGFPNVSIVKYGEKYSL